MLDQLKKAIFTAREENLEEIFTFINVLSEINLIDEKKKEDLLERHNKIKENLEGQLENMGFEQAERVETKDIFMHVVASPFLLLGYTGKGLGNLAVKIGKSIQGQDKALMAQFKKDLEQAFE